MDRMTDETTAGEGEEQFEPEDALAAELERLLSENAALKDQALRYAAEAENTKRRAEREANNARAFAIEKFARDLLGVADNLSRALQHAPREAADPAVKNLIIGLDMTEKELLAAFERNGLKKIDPVAGARFDPHQHQAMMEQPSAEIAAGGVVQVFQPGYELLGRLVRPAMVVVAAKGSTGTIGEATTPTAAQNPYAHANDTESGEAVDTKA
jgi:molecular chaperone GrpE